MATDLHARLSYCQCGTCLPCLARVEIERLTRAVESSGLKRLQADLERDAAVDDVAKMVGAIVGYVRAKRDGLGEVAYWWLELQAIANEVAAAGRASVLDAR